MPWVPYFLFLLSNLTNFYESFFSRSFAKKNSSQSFFFCFKFWDFDFSSLFFLLSERQDDAATFLNWPFLWQQKREEELKNLKRPFPRKLETQTRKKTDNTKKLWSGVLSHFRLLQKYFFELKIILISALAGPLKIKDYFYFIYSLLPILYKKTIKQ